MKRVYIIAAAMLAFAGCMKEQSAQMPEPEAAVYTIEVTSNSAVSPKTTNSHSPQNLQLLIIPFIRHQHTRLSLSLMELQLWSFLQSRLMPRKTLILPQLLCLDIAKSQVHWLLNMRWRTCRSRSQHLTVLLSRW